MAQYELEYKFAVFCSVVFSTVQYVSLYLRLSPLFKEKLTFLHKIYMILKKSYIFSRFPIIITLSFEFFYFSIFTKKGKNKVSLFIKTAFILSTFLLRRHFFCCFQELNSNLSKSNKNSPLLLPPFRSTMTL